MEQIGQNLSRKNKRERKSSQRGDRQRSKNSSASSSISNEAIAASLQSSSLGHIEFDDAELTELSAAVSRRHANCLRIRRGIDRDALPPPIPKSSPGSDKPFGSTPNHRRTIEPHVRSSTPPATSICKTPVHCSPWPLPNPRQRTLANANPLSGKLVLDLCAAPGGKASGLLEAIDEPVGINVDTPIADKIPRGFLLANEPIGSRIAPLAYNLARTGSDQYAITHLDPETLADRLPCTFDIVVVDAPCSGLALVARGKQSATAVAESQISLNAARQRRILQAAERLLKPGGRLVYSTCTFAVAENEEQVQFMTSELGLQAHPVPELATYASPLTEASYRLWPHRHRCAGSFAASLKKADRQTTDAQENHRQDYWTRIGAKAAAAEEAVEQLPILFGDKETRDQQRDWIIDRYADDAPDWTSEEYVVGPELAYRTGSTWKPSHAAALRETTRGHVPQLEVSDEIAKMYLSGQAIPALDRGWQVVMRRGRPLGWIKGDGRIGKNHLPAHARMTI